MTQLDLETVSEFEKSNPKLAEQELLKIEHGGLPVCVSDERSDQETIFSYEIVTIDSYYDLHSLDTFEYGDVLGNGAFHRKPKQLEMCDETESPRHVSSPHHSKVLEEDSACVKDTKWIIHFDKILKLKIYDKRPLLASETSEQENIVQVDLKHARRGKVDPVAVSILSKETEPRQVSSKWYSWRNIWCISLLMSILQQVVKQRQSKYRWLLLLLFFLPGNTGETPPCYEQVEENGNATLVFYDLNITQHTVQVLLDHCPPNKTSFDPVVELTIFSENNFTINLNPHGYVLVNLTKKIIIVYIPSVSLKFAGEYKFTAMDPKTISTTCSLIVTESTADVAESTADNAQGYNYLVPIFLGVAVLLVTIFFIAVYIFCPKMFDRFIKAKASTSEKCSEEEAQHLQKNGQMS